MYVFCCTTSYSDCCLTQCHVGQVTSIDMLSDDVLLGIFDFYVVEDGDTFGDRREEVEAWQLLVACVADGEALFLDHHIA
jgi:hypothetical protein